MLLEPPMFDNWLGSTGPEVNWLAGGYNGLSEMRGERPYPVLSLQDSGVD